MNKKNNYGSGTFLPVLAGFFIMGFVDVVGIATNYIKQDFNLSDTLSGFLPMMVFLWFAVLSIPSGILMNKIGRKNTVLLSMAVTFTALILPIFGYTFIWCLVAFTLIGIGNTLLQVSLNPLVSDVVTGSKLTSRLTLGQFIKAIASFLGPVIATFAATKFGDWTWIFPLYALITLLSAFWLLSIHITETATEKNHATFASSFALLKDSRIRLLFFGILFIVGLDVSINISTPKILMELCGLKLEKAGLGTSLYFAARTAGALLGAIVLSKLSVKKIYFWSMLSCIAIYLVMMLLGHNVLIIYIGTSLTGFLCANVFSIIFSTALQYKKEKGDEISGLMIMGVSGGAIFPFLMGVVSDAMGLIAGMGIILCCLLYNLFASVLLLKNTPQAGR